MDEYTNYLNYLHHIDDTTAQEFKKREDELRHQIDVVREQCQNDIRDIQEKADAEKAKLVEENKTNMDALASKYQLSVEELSLSHKSEIDKLTSEIKQLKEFHKADLQKTIDRKDAIIEELTNELDKLKAKKFSLRRIIEKIECFILEFFTESDSNSADIKEQNETIKQSNQDSIENRPLFCRKCGNPLKPGAQFCNKCGTKII